MNEWDADALIGSTIADRYRIEAQLGSGAMGVVLRCRQLELGHDVAVKLLHPELCTTPEVMRRFEREARGAMRLDHPNCVRVLDFGTAQVGAMPSSKYLCMELLSGVELIRLLDGPIAIDFAADVVGQLLDGLGHAHDQGVIHRDVKPHNVVVGTTESGARSVKLVDFGIAKLAGDEASGARITRRGHVCGTPSYMSPEQILDENVDGRADLYATGVLFYRLLAGRLPFESPELVGLMQMQVSMPPPPLPDSVPPALREVVAQLLAKRPEDRPQCAAEARYALDRACAEQERLAHLLPSAASRRPHERVVVVGAPPPNASRASTPKAPSAPRTGRLPHVVVWSAFAVAAVVFFTSPDLWAPGAAGKGSPNEVQQAGVVASSNQLARELEDAATADDPCAELTSVLQRIDADGDATALALLDQLRVPEAPREADDATRERCARLPELLEATRVRLRERAR